MNDMSRRLGVRRLAATAIAASCLLGGLAASAASAAPAPSHFAAPGIVTLAQAQDQTSSSRGLSGRSIGKLVKLGIGVVVVGVAGIGALAKKMGGKK